MAVQFHRYRFGAYEVRTKTRELYKAGIKLKLRPQPFRVLQVLVERAGDAVTRDEFREMLWPAETFVDFEHGLNTSVKELRKILNDSAGEPIYIQTLPKVGYRMIAPVESVGETAAPPAAESPSIVKPAVARSSLGARWFAVTAAILLIGVAALARFRPAASARLMLAVLPFENLTGDEGQEYLSDGLTEEMVAQIGRLGPERFGVIARTSAMRYKHTQERLSQIGSDLNVQYLLEGSVRRDARKIRVSAQLIRAQDETPIWSRQYDRDFANLLALEGEIAREISDEIQLTLGAENKPAKTLTVAPPSTRRPEAYDAYLKGLYFLNKRGSNEFWEAIRYFKDAVSKDPNYAAPYAGIADCYALIGGYSGQTLPEYIDQARAAAIRALQLDETLPEAHTALALIVQNNDWDWQTAGKEFERAIQLNPNYATAHHWYAEHLGYLGRFDGAFKESERARELDPLSMIIAADNAVLLYYSRRYDQSIEKFRSVMEMDRNLPRTDMIRFPYVEKKMFQDALALSEAQKVANQDQPYYWSDLAYIYGRAGRSEEARRAIEKMERLYQPDRTDPAVFVVSYCALQDKDACLHWLEKAYARHSNIVTTLRVDPAFDSLRGDPRFQSLLHRAGL